MRTKQPTIEDIYMADAYITTPGVRQGLLERAAEGNDDDVITDETDDGQVVYYRTPYGEMMPVGRPIMLAAAPAEAASDVMPSPVASVANIGRQAEIKAIDPTVRQQLAEFLQAGFERIGIDRSKARQNAQSLIGGPSSNLPLELGIVDIIPFIGTALQTQEAYRMGEQAVQDVERGNYGAAAIESVGAGVGLLPGGVATTKAVKSIARAARKVK